MIRLQTDVIDTQELIAAIQQSHHGAVSVFLGIVRDHNIGRKVLHLEYEAYEGMAETEMDRIRVMALEKFDLDALAMVHRTGKLTIGEASVVVVAASAHRAAAMDACRYAIDALKEKVPIWKKEFFEGGQEWIEGPGQPMRPV
jgi:molybdopterin synthase catalytic subunit